ncbi:hypothetical protein ECA1891 [Pectobacterium atrosepticum SCRI1043]|uniref:Uncharacterized protein n=1 Tax=Pectobacterium atrosepticum (strain SCRI 1043 / ATCC BAA-672) TaxID=218491 RepID=Q6D5Z7_PECAS|nr:hypothetical protein ECA1891 [Pectobacterium atrosepticum SCRI1043]
MAQAERTGMCSQRLYDLSVTPALRTVLATSLFCCCCEGFVRYTPREFLQLASHAPDTGRLIAVAP